MESSSLEFRIEFGLMGTLGFEDLLALYDRTEHKLSSNEWRVDWYEDVKGLVKRQTESTSLIPSNEFYQRIYQIQDIGLFHLETFSENSPVRDVRIIINDSILPSYQIQTQIRYACKSLEIYSEVWNSIKTINNVLRNLAKSAGLNPLLDTWTVCLTSNDGLNHPCIKDFEHDKKKIINNLFQNEIITIEAISEIGNTLIIKLLAEGREQCLIFSCDLQNDFAIAYLYHLMIAKKKMKELTDRLSSEYIESIENLQQEQKKYQILGKIGESDVKKLLSLRSEIVKSSATLKAIRSHIDLALSFLDFHVNTLLKNLTEKPPPPNVPSVIQIENIYLRLFFVEPLKSLIQRVEDNTKELLEFAETMIDIFTIQINLRSQKLIERLEIIAAIAAIISVILATVAFLV